MTFYEITEKDRELITAALEPLKNDYGDKAHYHIVGAALLTKSGKVYIGVNCDGIHGSCAEFIAMGAAKVAGENDFDTIVAVHKDAKNYVVSPCGNCRQTLFEYCPDVKVIVNNDEGELIKVGIRDLLPFAYVEL